jgi:hypothetical protein
VNRASVDGAGASRLVGGFVSCVGREKLLAGKKQSREDRVMKQQLLRTSSAWVFAIAAAGSLSGCASTSIERLSGPAFVQQADEVQQLNSGYWTSYVGCSSSRAYLEYAHPAYVGNGTRTTVYWTNLSELPDDFTAKLEAARKLGAEKPPAK